MAKSIRVTKITKAKLDKLFSGVVRRAGKCYRCGSTYNLQCAHIISRRYYQIRWDLKNALCLCAKCHMYFTYHPLEWEDWVKAEIGEGTYQELKEKALQYGKINHKIIYEWLMSI